MKYFLHSLNCLNNFAVAENEDFINVTKVIEYILIAIKVTFTTYIQENDPKNFDLFDLLLPFIKYFKRFNFRNFINFDWDQTIIINSFILIYFFEDAKL